MSRTRNRSLILTLGLVLLAACNQAAPPDPTSPEPPLSEQEEEPEVWVGADEFGLYTNDADGPITSPTDPRVVRVAPGGTFYVQVEFDDPSGWGVSSVVLTLINSGPAGFPADLVPGRAVNGFTLGNQLDPLSDCDLSGNMTSVTCTFPITVAPGTSNITSLPGAGSEFAYVLRVQVSDAYDGFNSSTQGYVLVGGAGAP